MSLSPHGNPRTDDANTSFIPRASTGNVNTPGVRYSIPVTPHDISQFPVGQGRRDQEQAAQTISTLTG